MLSQTGTAEFCTKWGTKSDLSNVTQSSKTIEINIKTYFSVDIKKKRNLNYVQFRVITISKIPARHSWASNSQLPWMDGMPQSSLHQALHDSMHEPTVCREASMLEPPQPRRAGWLAFEPLPFALCQLCTHGGKATVMQYDQSRENKWRKVLLLKPISLLEASPSRQNRDGEKERVQTNQPSDLMSSRHCLVRQRIKLVTQIFQSFSSFHNTF